MKLRSADLKRIKPGDPITAKFLNSLAETLRAVEGAVQKPTQKDIATGDSGGTTASNQEYTAGASDITSETVTITDSNGDTHDIDRITQIVFTNDADSSTLTLNISYT